MAIPRKWTDLCDLSSLCRQLSEERKEGSLACHKRNLQDTHHNLSPQTQTQDPPAQQPTPHMEKTQDHRSTQLLKGRVGLLEMERALFASGLLTTPTPGNLRPDSSPSSFGCEEDLVRIVCCWNLSPSEVEIAFS
jgi:hypothetical protein